MRECRIFCTVWIAVQKWVSSIVVMTPSLLTPKKKGLACLRVTVGRGECALGEPSREGLARGRQPEGGPLPQRLISTLLIYHDSIHCDSPTGEKCCFGFHCWLQWGWAPVSAVSRLPMPVSEMLLSHRSVSILDPDPLFYRCTFNFFPFCLLCSVSWCPFMGIGTVTVDGSLTVSI